MAKPWNHERKLRGMWGTTGCRLEVLGRYKKTDGIQKSCR